MDFLTAFPYYGIILLVIINALFVINRTIVVDDSDHKPQH